MRIELTQEDVLPFLSGVKTKERCGIMYGTSKPDRVMCSVVHVQEVPNRHPEPHKEFRINGNDVRSKWNGHRIVGVIHTHIMGMRGEPSPADIGGLYKPEHYGIVLHVPTKRVTFYDSEGMITSMKVKDLPSRKDYKALPTRRG